MRLPVIIAVIPLSYFLISLSAATPGASPGPIHVAADTADRDPFNLAVLDYINEMRANPRQFYEKHLQPYILQKGNRFTGQYTGSLRQTMRSSPPLPPFTGSPGLERAARLQADYLSRFKGRRLTHDQGNKNFAERMKEAGLACLAENLYAADNPDPLTVVMDLLIDQNVPSLGHRKNLMNSGYTRIAIVHRLPKDGRTIVVMDFGCTPQ